MPKVRVEPGSVEVEVDMGAHLIEALALALEARPDLFTEPDLFNDRECHAFVEILRGDKNLRGFREPELDALRDRGMPIGTAPVRHSCQTLVFGDVTVRLMRRGRPMPSF